MPIIGITQRQIKKDDFVEAATHQEYIDAILRSGGDPLLLTTGTKWDRKEKKRLHQWLRQCEGILITGGCDPTKYDYYILDYAIKHRLPVLGICLGMQIMGTYRNQNELKPIGTNKHQKPKERYVHKVSLDPSSKLFTYFGNTREIEVNSRHVEQITTGGMFSVIGRSEDGIMEALENPTHSFQIGVQWHPESMIDYDENSRKLWKEFVKQCKKNKK